MLEIKNLDFKDLSNEEKKTVPNNGMSKEYASYIKVIHNNEVICLKSDAMEKEDAVFYRDLSWIVHMLKECYDLGRLDETNSRKKWQNVSM